MPNMEALHRQGRAGDDDLEPEDAEEYEDVEDLHEDMGPLGGDFRGWMEVSCFISYSQRVCQLFSYSLQLHCGGLVVGSW